jgi:hypothetical protein
MDVTLSQPAVGCVVAFDWGTGRPPVTPTSMSEDNAIWTVRVAVVNAPHTIDGGPSPDCRLLDARPL